MATALISNENARFTDLYDEPVDRLLTPIRGYEDKPFVSLPEAIKPICGLFNQIEDNVFVALHNSQNPSDDLTEQESASIHLYTMQFHGGPSLYLLLNQSLCAEDREQLKPWFSYLKLFLTALHKLPSESERVWRGIKNIDLSSKYKTGTKFVWWGVSSCTTHIDVLQSNAFLGKTGERTIFSIDCFNGKSISNHSYFKNKEKEIILIPGSYFEVMGQLNPAPQLHIIQVKQIPSPIPFVKSPFSTSPNINPFVTEKLNTLSQSIPNSTSDVLEKEIPLKSSNNWKQCTITVAGGNGYGNQFNHPFGIVIDDDLQTIYIADCFNHRIIQWKFNEDNGQIVVGQNRYENETNQLSSPTDVTIDKENNSLIIADRDNRRVIRWSHQNNTTNGQIIIENIRCYSLTMDQNGSLYVSDYEKNEVRRWKRGETNGTIVAGGNGRGDHLDQLNCPTYIFVDDNYSLYVSDNKNHRVIKWINDAKEGIVVAGGNGQGNRLSQLSDPCGVIVDQFGQIYVSDWWNDRVMCWSEDGKEGTIVVGGNGCGEKSNQLNYPTGLSFDRQRNLYIVDQSNHRIQKLEID